MCMVPIRQSSSLQLTCSLKHQTTSSYCAVCPNKIGTSFPSDGIEAMKCKLGLVYGMNLPFPQRTQLLYTNAEVDCSVFTSLSSLLERLPSSPAHGNIYSLGLPSDYELEEIEVRIVLCMLISTTHEAHLFSRMGWDNSRKCAYLVSRTVTEISNCLKSTILTCLKSSIRKSSLPKARN